jgi:hypothetical protein
MPDKQTMQDWTERIRKHLDAESLPPGNREEVILELAAHLEELYEAARSQGLTEATAVELALQEVNDWHVLAAKIRRAKSKEDPVNDRTKNLWLPGMITLLGASLLLMALQRTGFRPRLVWMGDVAMLFYWPWLAGLPVFGALGAYLSQRARGPIRTRLAAGLSPALVLLIAFGLSLPFGLAIDGLSLLRLGYFGLAVVNWVAIPGLALLLGALPFLKEPQMTKI